jgi:predicted DNA-binding protein
MAKRKTYQNLYVGLTPHDQKRLATLAKRDGKTKTELAREALTWYLDQRENEEHAERDGVYAKAIKEMTNRICGMLARQGTALGVLYELTWRSLSDAESRSEFDSIVNQVKAKQRKRLDGDEKALTAKMAAVVKQ